MWLMIYNGLLNDLIASELAAALASVPALQKMRKADEWLGLASLL